MKPLSWDFPLKGQGWPKPTKRPRTHQLMSSNPLCFVREQVDKPSMDRRRELLA